MSDPTGTVLAFPAPEDSTAAVPCDVLFVERPGRRDMVVPVIGLEFPAPQGGYPLRLADGTLALLSSPPWQMGHSR